MKKRTKIIIVAVIAAVIIIGGVAAFLLLSGSGGDETPVYVQSVAEITGIGSGTGLKNRYAGIVEAQDVIKIELDQGKTLDEC